MTNELNNMKDLKKRLEELIYDKGHLPSKNGIVTLKISRAELRDKILNLFEQALQEKEKMTLNKVINWAEKTHGKSHIKNDVIYLRLKQLTK